MAEVQSQLYLFTGENTYAITEEVQRWKQTFREKHGEANLAVTTGKELVWPIFRDEVQSAPFLGGKRLIIIEGIPGASAEEWEALEKTLHEETIIVCIEPAPDRRKSVVKFLLKAATVRSFPHLTKQQLIPWIRSLGERHHVVIGAETAARLIDLVGMDQWYLLQECRKAIAYAAPRPPSPADIDAVCLPSGTHAVWVLSDLIGKGKTAEAAEYSAALFRSGEDVFSLWNLFLYTVRSIVTLWIFSREKSLPAAALARESGVNFLSVQALLPFVRTLSPEQVCRIAASAAAADRALKTGEIRATATHGVELIALLERQLLGLGV